jgi:hypothetical protein
MQIQALVARLQSTGYTHMALTHVIYGRPVSTTTNLDQTVDVADIAVPKSLYSNIAIKKQTMHILRRLHAIVETVSDVAMYHSIGNIKDTNNPSSNNNRDTRTQQLPQQQQQQQLLLRGYDLISLGPTNDATFQAACRHAMAVDIVTVDYTQRLGWKLPYQIQTQDLQALIDRGGSLEICVAPALLNIQHRKSLIHACREVLLACQSLTNLKHHQHHQQQLLPPIILSSGNRTLIDNYSQNGENDAGALALRTPGDLQTLAKTLLGFPCALVGACMNTVPAQVIQHAQQRRLGNSSCASVVLHQPIQIKDNNEAIKTTSKAATISKEHGGMSSRGDADLNSDNDDQKDGVIAM